MTYCLVTYRENGDARLGILPAGASGPPGLGSGGRELIVPPELKRWHAMLELLNSWPEAAAMLSSLALDDAPRVPAAELLTPISWPRKVLCAGVNYRKHAIEMGCELPGKEWQPYFFFKPPTTTVIGPADPIVIRDAD